VLATLLLVFAAATPAAADDGYVDLNVQVYLDKQAYYEAEEVRATVYVTNGGTAPATGVVLRSEGELGIKSWGEFDESGPGVVVPPGEQRAVEVTAPAYDPGDGMFLYVTAVSAEPDANPEDNEGTGEGFVTCERCDVTFTVYEDADEDAAADPDELAVGVLVTLSGGVEMRSIQVRSDANGVVRFTAIPGGEYYVTANLRKDWYLDTFPTIRLHPGHNEKTLRAQLVDLSKLVATVSLDRDSYAVGDTVRERVTLTNTGTRVINGLLAHCGGYGTESVGNALDSTGWLELDPATPKSRGARLHAGETRVWEFTAEVPSGAWSYGFVTLECEFMVPGMLQGAYAEDRAAVPGGQGSLGGTLLREDQPIPGVEVLMVNKATGAVAARTVSDGAGHFHFAGMAADVYELLPLGRWRLRDRSFEAQVFAGEHREFPIVLEEAPEQRDPEEPPPVTETPAPAPAPAPEPQARSAPRPTGLADTGADVADLTAAGFLLVVLGLVLVRRRSTT
jgi:LPXTG-motif cell wall-anchored protein